jgi:hypothetical protein
MLAPIGWLVALPGRTLAAPGRLAGATRDLESIEHDTRSLPDIERSMCSIAKDTDLLNQVARDIAEVAQATSMLEMATIEGAMPVLVEVQRHLALVPEKLEHLDQRLGELSATLERLMVGMEPLSRVADRFPGRSRQHNTG